MIPRCVRICTDRSQASAMWTTSCRSRICESERRSLVARLRARAFLFRVARNVTLNLLHRREHDFVHPVIVYPVRLEIESRNTVTGRTDFRMDCTPIRAACLAQNFPALSAAPACPQKLTHGYKSRSPRTVRASASTSGVPLNEQTEAQRTGNLHQVHHSGVGRRRLGRSTARSGGIIVYQGPGNRPRQDDHPR